MNCINSYNYARGMANGMIANNMMKNNLYDNNNQPMMQAVMHPDTKPNMNVQYNGFGQQPIYSTPVGPVQPTPYSQAMNFTPAMETTQPVGQYFVQPMEAPAQYAPTPTPVMSMGEVIASETAGSGAGPVDFSQLLATPVFDIEYTQGYLRTQIGRRVKVEFLIGTSMLVDREGVLMDVGISYIIIQETETDDLLLCDIYSIKFVKFYY